MLEFDVTIEIPKGARNKYVVDGLSRRIRQDRTLFTSTQYPGDYGFVDDSLGPGIDALDALVLVLEPTFPGCVIRCRALGMFQMHDEHGPTPKVVCVPTAELRQASLQDIFDVDHFYRLEIQHFFGVYKRIEPGKSVQIEDEPWVGHEAAEAEVRQACARAGH